MSTSLAVGYDIMLFLLLLLYDRIEVLCDFCIEMFLGVIIQLISKCVF